MNKHNTPLYLDWAATAPLRPEVAEAIRPYLDPHVLDANTNSLHSPGRVSFAVLEDARKTVSQTLGARRPNEIVFTSGATEANNAAVYGIVSACVKRRKHKGESNFVPHIITTHIEHDSILEATKVLKSLGCEVSSLAPNRQGFIEEDDLKEALTKSTALVSIQMANNEIGSIQPVARYAKVVHQQGALLHVDAVQALGKTPLNMQELGVDALSVSSHKIGGPKGVGALYLKANTPFDALLSGGGQEEGRRSGTHNLAGIVGFAKACELAGKEQDRASQQLGRMRDALYQKLSNIKRIHPTIQVSEGSHDFLPHIVSVCVEGMESETLILRLDEKGFAVSGGSACSSSSLEPSHVLRALGIAPNLIQGALRISFGATTRQDDLDRFCDALQASLAR